MEFSALPDFNACNPTPFIPQTYSRVSSSIARCRSQPVPMNYCQPQNSEGKKQSSDSIHAPMGINKPGHPRKEGQLLRTELLNIHKFLAVCQTSSTWVIFFDWDSSTNRFDCMRIGGFLK